MGDIFRRVEKKYIISKKQYIELRKYSDEYMVEDEHGKSTIRNIYFDSEMYDLISHSITKPFFKDKVRARSYNKPNKDSKVFLEIKRKYDGVVGKRRIEMKLSDLERYVENGSSPNIENTQIKRELDYYFEKYQLRPAMYLSYSREAFYQKDDRDMRITFDSNIIARPYDIRLDSENYGTNILDQDLYVMEIKTLGAMPMWLVKILNEVKISPCGFSKYGEAYTQLILEANDYESCVI
ncbi:MAG: polyphosphate polymerase domain-containing protein [Clostridia bacterium]|nr:polyphosphate polymerase domain-containing protein [Clostridia bacterium]